MSDSRSGVPAARPSSAVTGCPSYQIDGMTALSPAEPIHHVAGGQGAQKGRPRRRGGLEPRAFRSVPDDVQAAVTGRWRQARTAPTGPSPRISDRRTAPCGCATAARRGPGSATKFDPATSRSRGRPARSSRSPANSLRTMKRSTCWSRSEALVDSDSPGGHCGQSPGYPDSSDAGRLPRPLVDAVSQGVPARGRANCARQRDSCARSSRPGSACFRSARISKVTRRTKYCARARRPAGTVDNCARTRCADACSRSTRRAPAGSQAPDGLCSKCW